MIAGEAVHGPVCGQGHRLGVRLLAGYGSRADTIGANHAGRTIARQVMADLEENVRALGPAPASRLAAALAA